MKKRGQFWYADFIIGITMMVTISILFFSTIISLYESNDKIEDLINNGVVISDYFMTSGYLPLEWDTGNGRVGFVDYGRLNEDNLILFGNLDYENSQYLLGTSYDYIVYFENSTSVLDITGDRFIGNTEIESVVDITNVDTEHMIKLIRFVYYGGDIIKMVVVIWE